MRFAVAIAAIIIEYCACASTLAMDISIEHHTIGLENLFLHEKLLTKLNHQVSILANIIGIWCKSNKIETNVLW